MNDAMPETPADGGPWWVIHEDEIVAALRKCAAGEDPDIVYIELMANSTYEEVEGE